MAQNNDCACSAAPKLIFACSGAADVGEITDRAAREMTRRGSGKMFCLAGIGGRVPPIMQATQTASKILALDGCPLDCVKNSLTQAGFETFRHLRLTDMGLEKGNAAVTQETIAQVARAGAELLAD